MKISRGTKVRLTAVSVLAAIPVVAGAASADYDPDDVCHQVIATGQPYHCHQLEVVGGAVDTAVELAVETAEEVDPPVTLTVADIVHYVKYGIIDWGKIQQRCDTVAPGSDCQPF